MQSRSLLVLLLQKFVFSFKITQKPKIILKISNSSSNLLLPNYTTTFFLFHRNCIFYISCEIPLLALYILETVYTERGRPCQCIVHSSLTKLYSTSVMRNNQTLGSKYLLEPRRIVTPMCNIYPWIVIT